MSLTKSWSHEYDLFKQFIVLNKCISLPNNNLIQINIYESSTLMIYEMGQTKNEETVEKFQNSLVIVWNDHVSMQGICRMNTVAHFVTPLVERKYVFDSMRS